MAVARFAYQTAVNTIPGGTTQAITGLPASEGFSAASVIAYVVPNGTIPVNGTPVVTVNLVPMASQTLAADYGIAYVSEGADGGQFSFTANGLTGASAFEGAGFPLHSSQHAIQATVDNTVTSIELQFTIIFEA